jgi:thiamine biosynthesis lipoprotein
LRLSLSIILLLLAASPSAETVERRLVVMGTSLEISVTASSRREALDASEAAVRELARVEALLSTWKDGGPLARLNAAPADRPVALPAELFGLLEGTFAWSERTLGTFEPAILPLVAAWGLRTGGRLPSRDELAEALAATGHRRLCLDAPSSSAWKLHPGAGIDEGAWGKGYALDRAADVLRARGVAAAVLDLGGQVLSITAGSSDGIRVEVADPRDRSRVIGRVFLKNGSLSTSGNSERAVSAGGLRIGHLLDPRSGTPAPDFGSVTVLAPSGLVADLLSTALFVAGPEEGPKLSRRLRAEGVPHEVLYLVKRGDGLEARASAGLVSAVEDLEVPLLLLAETTPPAGEASGGKQPEGGISP